MAAFRGSTAALTLQLVCCLLFIWPDVHCQKEKIDTSVDWLADLAVSNASACTLPPAPRATPPPSCPPASRDLTPQELDELGYLLAPKIFLHQDEWSMLADPEKWLLNTPIYDKFFYAHNFTELQARYEANPFQFIYTEGKDYFASSMFDGDFSSNVTTRQLRRRVAGDPLDEQNRSTAKVWFSAVHPLATWNSTIRLNSSLVFNFNFFYPFNGCSNQLLSVSFNARFQGIEYYMCSNEAGLHEGDWERMSMYTCVSDLLELLAAPAQQRDPVRVIRRIQYAQHSWAPEYNCSQAGQCPFEEVDGINRTVVFSGLFSHATYPSPSPLWVYQEVNLQGLIANMNGLYIADRTSAAGPTFVPTRDNIKRIATNDITGGQQPPWSWYIYPGSWGGFYVGTDEWCVQCFHDKLQTQGPCNMSNPAAYYMYEILGLRYNVIDSVSNLTWLFTLNTSQPAPVQDLTSPLFRDYTHNWQDASWAPASNEGTTCPYTGNTVPSDPGYDIGSAPSLLAYALSIVALMVASGVVFTLLLFFPSVAPEKVHVPTGYTSLPMVRRLSAKGLAALRLSSKRAGAEATGPGTGPGAGPGKGSSQGLSMHVLNPLSSAADAHGLSHIALTAAPQQQAMAGADPLQQPVRQEAQRHRHNVSGAPLIVEGKLQPDSPDTEKGEDSCVSLLPKPVHTAAVAVTGQQAATPAAGLATAKATTAVVQTPNGPMQLVMALNGDTVPGIDAGGMVEGRAATVVTPRGGTMLVVTHPPPTSTYHASRHLFWLAFAVAMYIAGMVLSVLGVADLVRALNEVYPLHLYSQLESALVAVLVTFAGFELITVGVVVFTRSHEKIALCLEACIWRNPCRCSTADSWGFITQAIIAGFLVIEINVCTVYFALGFALWCMRYLLAAGCSTALAALFDVTGNLARNVCINFALVGKSDTTICAYQLTEVCFFWSSVRIQFLVYAAYLLSFSHLMFLGCIVHNLHLLRTWQTTVRHDPPAPQQQGYVHAAP